VRLRAAALVFLAAAAAAAPAFSADPAPASPIISWSKPGYKISRLAFSADGRELLVEMRLYVRPGSLGAAVDQQNRQARRYDPLLGILALADRRYEELVHGRDGHLSRDGRLMAFIAQETPATFEQAETTTDLVGNFAAVYDRSTGKSLALARPLWEVHSAPRVTPDGKRVTYLDLVPTNDGVHFTRLTEFDLASRQSRILFEPPLVGATPVLIWQYGHVGNRLLATLLVPQVATRFANAPVEFVQSLVEIQGGKSVELFNWGRKDAHLREMERLQILNDSAMTFDGAWRRIPKQGPPGGAIGRIFGDDESPGVPSPDGRLLARAVIGEDGNARFYTAIVVEEIDTGTMVARFPLDKARGLRPECIAWSADSRRIAWPNFATSNWVEDQDTLFVATLP
jgi:hypothetical protein